MKQGAAAESTYIHSLCLCYLRYTASFINEKSGHSFLLLLVAILLVLKTSSHLRYKVLCTTTKVQSYKFSVRSCLLRLKSCLLHLRLESCLLGLSWIYQSRSLVRVDQNMKFWSIRTDLFDELNISLVRRWSLL